jgi:hypothetical protein
MKLGCMLAVLALLAAACGGSGSDALEIGIKRIALDLAFKDDTKAEPLAPARVIEVIGAPPDTIAPLAEDPLPRPRLPSTTVALPPAPRCPEAAPDNFPKEPVTIFIRGVPKEGTYRLHNRGTIKITTATFTLNLPFPAVSTWKIRNVVATPQVPSEFPKEVRDIIDPGDIVTFDIEKQLGPTLRIIDSIKYDRTTLSLTKRVTISEGRRDELNPTPAITFMKTDQGDGDSWSSAGMDRGTNTAMVVQGSIEKREFVDICGERFDAWKVLSTESTANLVNSEHSETDVQQPNVYRFANQFAALVLQEEGHFSSTLLVDGTPVTVEFDYVSTLDSIEPLAGT